MWNVVLKLLDSTKTRCMTTYWIIDMHMNLPKQLGCCCSKGEYPVAVFRMASIRTSLHAICRCCCIWPIWPVRQGIIMCTNYPRWIVSIVGQVLKQAPPQHQIHENDTWFLRVGVLRLFLNSKKSSHNYFFEVPSSDQFEWTTSGAWAIYGRNPSTQQICTTRHKTVKIDRPSHNWTLQRTMLTRFSSWVAVTSFRAISCDAQIEIDRVRSSG